MVNNRGRQPARTAAGIKQAAVDFSVFTADIRATFSSQQRIKATDGGKYLTTETKIAAEKWRRSRRQPTRVSAIIKLPQKTQQAIL